MAATEALPQDTLSHLIHLYRDEARRFACRAQTPDEVDAWQREARPALQKLIGLDRIKEDVGTHQPQVTLEEPIMEEGYVRRHGTLTTEPGVRLPFWLLTPGTEAPHPLVLTLHGHSSYGYNLYAGLPSDEAERERMLREDRDVAVQAVQQGFAAIAPATRGFLPVTVPDLKGRHGGRDCRSQLVHSLLAGRTVIGERVWDVMRILDWATASLTVKEDQIVVLGNSGGGVLTLYASACDKRIAVAVPSCSFAPYVSLKGYVHHCDCNLVPGILRFGEFWDVAGLIAPRPLLIVSGKEDKLFPPEEVDRAVSRIKKIYDAANAGSQFSHRTGEGGHRFYKALMWPFIWDHL